MQFSRITLFPTVLDEQEAMEVQEEIIPTPLPQEQPVSDSRDFLGHSNNGNGHASIVSGERGESLTWDGPELDGELVVDVYETESHIVVIAPIAGARADDLDITVVNDLLTIRGSRHHDSRVGALEPIYRECHWGGFSRSIILSTEVQSERVKAFLKQGILTVLLPKRSRNKVRVEELEFEP